MNKMVLFFAASVWLLAGGCRPEAEESLNSPVESEIIARAAYFDSQFDNEKPILFTGKDILWFNEATKELRFRQNIVNAAIINEFRDYGIQFYIRDEFLLFAEVYVGVWNYKVINYLVLHYDMINNKYFLLDGFPEVSLLSDPVQMQAIRDANRKAIEQEWNRFMAQLKKENLYRSN